MSQEIEKITEFFNQRSVNKTGVCFEIGISPQHLNRILSGKSPLTDKMSKKINNTLKKYGYA